MGGGYLSPKAQDSRLPIKARSIDFSFAQKKNRCSPVSQVPKASFLSKGFGASLTIAKGSTVANLHCWFDVDDIRHICNVGWRGSQSLIFNETVEVERSDDFLETVLLTQKLYDVVVSRGFYPEFSYGQYNNNSFGGNGGTVQETITLKGILLKGNAIQIFDRGFKRLFLETARYHAQGAVRDYALIPYECIQ